MLEMLKLHVGSTITSFWIRLNKHKISLKRYERSQRGNLWEHSYMHIHISLFEEGHAGLTDVRVKTIHKTNLNHPTGREGFWTYKLDTFIPS